MKKYPVYSALFIVLIIAILLGFPAKNKAIENLKECKSKRILLEELQNLMQEGQPIAIVDAREDNNYVEGHIKGAVNIPANKFKQDASKKLLPSNKEILVVYYCAGPRCSAACKAAIQGKDLGYTKFHVYEGGYPEWESKGMPIEK